MEYYLAMKKEILPLHGWTLSAYAKRHKSDREKTNPNDITVDGSKVGS